MHTLRYELGINQLVMAGFVRARSMSTKTFAPQEASRRSSSIATASHSARVPA
jgi:hypothetical protein